MLFFGSSFCISISTSYIGTREGITINNGDTVQFDEQSNLPTVGALEFTVHYNGTALTTACIKIVNPVNSISVSGAYIEF